MPPGDLPSYVRWVIDQKPELHDTPDDVKSALQEQLEDRLEDLINAALVAALPSDELPEFERLLDKGDQEVIQNFCRTHIPDLEERVAEVMLTFRNQYLGA